MMVPTDSSLLLSSSWFPFLSSVAGIYGFLNIIEAYSHLTSHIVHANTVSNQTSNCQRCCVHRFIVQGATSLTAQSDLRKKVCALMCSGYWFIGWVKWVMSRCNSSRGMFNPFCQCKIKWQNGLMVWSTYYCMNDLRMVFSVVGCGILSFVFQNSEWRVCVAWIVGLCVDRLVDFWFLGWDVSMCCNWSERCFDGKWNWL